MWVVTNPNASIELDSFDERDRSAPPDIPSFVSSLSLFCNTYESRPVYLHLETSFYKADSLDLYLATCNTEPFDGNYHRRTTHPQFALKFQALPPSTFRFKTTVGMLLRLRPSNCSIQLKSMSYPGLTVLQLIEEHLAFEVESWNTTLELLYIHT